MYHIISSLNVIKKKKKKIFVYIKDLQLTFSFKKLEPCCKYVSENVRLRLIEVNYGCLAFLKLISVPENLRYHF